MNNDKKIILLVEDDDAIADFGHLQRVLRTVWVGRVLRLTLLDGLCSGWVCTSCRLCRHGSPLRHWGGVSGVRLLVWIHEYVSTVPTLSILP